MNSRNTKTYRKGAALLVVLFIVMVITVVSLGFLSRSDAELLCGRNMILKSEMDFLAESALEHARGLILRPQSVSTPYWTGDVQQQLTAGSDDYYNVTISKLGPCNYSIDCSAYRQKSGEQVGLSRLTAELRLDPCIALWLGSGSTISSNSSVTGDVYCAGTVTNNGTIDGDVFCNALVGAISGRQMAVAELELTWPRVTEADFTSNYSVLNIDVNSLSAQTIGPYSPVRVCRYAGDLELAGDVVIESMLIVDGNLTVTGDNNIIRAAKNLPALFVTGDLIIEVNGELDVFGLAVVEGAVQAKTGSVDLDGHPRLDRVSGKVDMGCYEYK